MGKLERPVRMSLAIQERISQMADDWSKRGYDLGLGIGIAQGYATIGAIGFEARWDYSAIGTVTNLAARLCGEAAANQILISQRIRVGVEPFVELDPEQVLRLKGFHRPIISYRVRGLKPLQS